MKQNKNHPLVSIAITTYNHEKYIARCIDSVLMQITSFDYEIIIGHDASPDNSLQILKDYESRHPHIIKVINHKKNVGLRQNNISVWSKCQGKYIAYLEGDDYWTDKSKLELQVNFLEKNPQYSGSFHQVKLKHENSDRDSLMPSFNYELDLGFIDNLTQWQVGTCSFVFRNFLISEENIKLKTEFLKEEIFWTDRPLMAFVSSFGPYKYFPICAGVWRQHDSNMTKIGDLSAMYRAGGIAYYKMYTIFPKYRIPLSEQVIRWNLKACEQSLRNKQWKNGIVFNLKAFLNIKSVLGIKNYFSATFKILLRKDIYA